MSCCFCLYRHPFIWYLLKDHLTSELLFRFREASHVLRTVALELTYGLWQSNVKYFDYARNKTEVTWQRQCTSTRPSGLAVPA